MMARKAARPATQSELATWRGDLSSWLTPSRFAALVESLSNTHGDHAIDQPGSVFRDAFVASKCAAELAADGVRLGADPPDFELSFGERVERYEIVEVQAPGRRRGDELKADLKSPEDRARPVHVPAEEWTPAASVLRQLEEAARRKAAKGYPADTVLVVYLNVWPVAGARKVSAGLAAALAPAHAAFKAVWVLDNGRLERIAR